MLEVNMLGGKNQIVVVVLYVHQLVIQFPPVMVINNDNGSGNRLVSALFIIGNCVLYQIPYCLRPVREMVLFYNLIQRRQQFVFEGYSESFHCGTNL
jgi:hypothetical protein